MRLLSQPLRRSHGPTARGTSRTATFGSWPGGRSGHTYLTLVYQSPPQPACADEESCQEPAATPAADPQLVPRLGRHLGRRRRRIQRQSETDHQKSLRLQNAAGQRNGSVSRPRTTTRARMYPQILLRRQFLSYRFARNTIILIPDRRTPVLIQSLGRPPPAGAGVASLQRSLLACVGYVFQLVHSRLSKRQLYTTFGVR